MKAKEKSGLVLFLDESGDHSLSKIDPQYPMFVQEINQSGIIIAEARKKYGVMDKKN